MPGLTIDILLDQMKAAAFLPSDDVRDVLKGLVPEYMGHERVEAPQNAIAGKVTDGLKRPAA